ncbi:MULTISPECIES: YggT family protein [Salinivibrio]|jgi:YggT family protein|uniref:YggT family protein n=2 Tax=Salinivibrio TaxID=51366 RepID=A0ABY7LBE2_9GAMM|nr:MULTISPECIES: YggT family protein [Salinivibrio]ODP96059.1 hypothetical protein BGK46_15295 [Salinivibrio sp. DV]OOF20584.1 YggT family protein [Salinivibrio sp. IB574]OOF24547.1 YggT family protein [Salinivibrio sp. IB872]QIR06934.1 YggT family protein [Salinivibrio costicola]WBA14413.1 YggT family protein [Salinivibrio proteolyticus]
MNAMTFLINTAFDLYIMVVLLRVWLQLARADFYNPFSQFVVKATQPVVGPLRRLIPALGGLDLATVLFGYLLMVAKFAVLDLVAGNPLTLSGGMFIFSAIALLKAAGKLLFWVLILRAILSWVSQGNNPVEYVFHQLTEPVCAPVRRVIPPIGGLDLSILVVFIALQFINMLIGDFLGPVWYAL